MRHFKYYINNKYFKNKHNFQLNIIEIIVNLQNHFEVML